MPRGSIKLWTIAPTTPEITAVKYPNTSDDKDDTNVVPVTAWMWIDETVASLSVLANRPEDLPQTSAAAGGVAIDLEGGYGGVMLARPNPDGTWETKCVFTFAEGAEFLGLVEENSTE